MAESNIVGNLASDGGYSIGEPGQANSMTSLTKTVSAIADSVATTIFTLNLPNANLSALVRVTIRAGITNPSHTYDSTRVAMFLISVTRLANVAAVAVLSAAIGAQIATSAGGQTLTMTPALQGPNGAATAVQTINFQTVNVNGSAGTTDVEVLVEVLNGAGTQPVGAAVPSGVTAQ